MEIFTEHTTQILVIKLKFKKPKYHKTSHTEERNHLVKEKETQFVIKMIKYAMVRKILFKYVLCYS